MSAIETRWVLLLFFFILTIGCDKREDESPNGDGIYYGDPTRVGELKQAVLYFMRNDQWEDAETTMRTIINSNVEHDDRRALVNNYSILSLCQKMQGKSEQALVASRQELKIARTLSPAEPASECEALLNMASAQLMLEELAEAKQSLQEARDIAERHKLHEKLNAIKDGFRLVGQLEN